VRLAAAAVLAASLAACRGTDPAMREDAVAYAQLAAHQTRAEMEQADPAFAKEISAAAGWAAFGSTGDSLFGRRPGDGLGLAHDNRTGKETPMRVNVADADRSLGLQRFRAVFVFSDAAAFARFVKGGDVPSGGEGVDVRWTQDGVAVPPPAGATCRPE
jgi:hypothetical protein